MDAPEIFGWMAALNDPTRARLLRVVEQNELNVSELSAVLQLPQSTTSRHIKALVGGTWLSSRREGTSRHYRLDEATLQAAQRRLWNLLREGLASDQQVANDDERLQRVLFERQQKGQDFFADSARHWDRLRAEMFGSEFELRLLAALLPEHAIVCDLGCGTGRMTELLSPFAQHVIGVDASEAMIEAARQRLRPSTNTTIHRAQLKELPLDDDSIDVALMVLVLHYVSDPLAALKEAERVLRPGGKLVLVDMQPHDRTDYRPQMGHLWQGFAPEQVKEWFSEAKFGDVNYTRLPPERSAKGPPLFVSSAHTENPNKVAKRFLLLNSK